jgi:magnesium transporter
MSWPSRPRSTNASAPSPDRYPCHLFLSAYTVSLDPAPGELVAHEIAVFITDHALITVRKDTGPRSC